MVVNPHRSRPTSVGNFNRVRRWFGSCSIRIHALLMQKTYRNILVLILGFCVLHLLFGGKVFLVVALTVLAFSSLSFKAAVFIETAWLWIGEKLGTINAAILLFLIYYLILTPIAFLSRIGSNDPLQLKPPSKSNFASKNHRYVADDLRNPW